MKAWLKVFLKSFYVYLLIFCFLTLAVASENNSNVPDPHSNKHDRASEIWNLEDLDDDSDEEDLPDAFMHPQHDQDRTDVPKERPETFLDDIQTQDPVRDAINAKNYNQARKILNALLKTLIQHGSQILLKSDEERDKFSIENKKRVQEVIEKLHEIDALESGKSFEKEHLNTALSPLTDSKNPKEFVLFYIPSTDPEYLKAEAENKKQALASLETSIGGELGPEGKGLLIALSWLAQVYKNLKDYKNADLYSERALLIKIIYTKKCSMLSAREELIELLDSYLKENKIEVAKTLYQKFKDTELLGYKPACELFL